MHPAWIEIDLDQFRKNLAIIKEAIGNVRLCLPIKANAYGHGLIKMAEAATRSKVDYLAVAHLQEAIDLRRSHITTPILVLGAIHEEQIEALLELDLEFTVSSPYKAMLVGKLCEKIKKVGRVHLEVDTGMRRTGMRPETALMLYKELMSSKWVRIEGIYSHLATGNTPNDATAWHQINVFTSLMQNPLFSDKPLLRHLANSAATQLLSAAHFDMVRPALLSFGYSAENAPVTFSGIAPCFSLKAKVSYFKVVERGEGISYGHTHIASTRTRVVTVPVGYGDGYRRCLSNKGSVLIHGKRYPIVGSICMDQFMVDVGDDSVFVGDEVVLIGRQGQQEISIKEIASLCDTIPYEILCLFNDRIPRHYIGN